MTDRKTVIQKAIENIEENLILQDLQLDFNDSLAVMDPQHAPEINKTIEMIRAQMAVQIKFQEYLRNIKE